MIAAASPAGDVERAGGGSAMAPVARARRRVREAALGLALVALASGCGAASATGDATPASGTSAAAVEAERAAAEARADAADAAAAAAPQIDLEVVRAVDAAFAAAEDADGVAFAARQHDLLRVAGAVPALGAAVRSRTRSSLDRQLAAWALAEWGSADACAALGADLEPSAPVDTRLAHAVAVARCGDTIALRGLLRDTPNHVRLKAAVTLGWLDAVDARRAVAALREDPALAEGVAFADLALALLGDAEALQRARLDLLVGELPAFAIAVEVAALRADDATADAALVAQAATRHTDPIVRQAAVEALLRAGASEAAAALSAALVDPSPRVAAWAQQRAPRTERP